MFFECIAILISLNFGNDRNTRIEKMLQRIFATTAIGLLLTICGGIPCETPKKCNSCKHLVETGLSPYENLWTLKEEIGSELPSELLERKMMFLTEDLKTAEGTFLEYCRQTCQKLFENQTGEEAAENLAKRGKKLHFLTKEEEEKFTELAKREFEKPTAKNKPENHVTVNLIQKNSSELSRETEKTPLESDDKSMKLEENVKTISRSENSSLTDSDIVARFDSSRPLPNINNSFTTGQTVPAVAKTPEEGTTSKPPEIKPETSDVKNGSVPEKNLTNVSAIPEMELPNNSTPKVNQLTQFPKSNSSEVSNTKPLTALPSVTASAIKPSKEAAESDETEKESSEEDLSQIIQEVFAMTPRENAWDPYNQAIQQTADFVKCVVDVTLLEIEQVLGLPPGTFKREGCFQSKIKWIPILFDQIRMQVSQIKPQHHWKSLEPLYQMWRKTRARSLSSDQEVKRLATVNSHQNPGKYGRTTYAPVRYYSNIQN